MTQHLIMRGVIPRIRFVSDGTLSEYDFPFAIFKNSDLKVYFGSELQDPITYTVSGAGESDGGTVTLSHVPESGVIITLTRELAIERTSDFQEGGALRANTLNHELDYQIACQQQIADNLNRSMVLPPYAADSDVKLTLPMPQAGKAIVWNSDGTNLENSTVAVNALENTLRGYKESAESASVTAVAKADIATIQATTATTQAGIATQKAQEAASVLASKTNTDLDNLTNIGKNKILDSLMPDYSRAITLTSNAPFTPTENGYVEIACSSSGGSDTDLIEASALDTSKRIISFSIAGANGIGAGQAIVIANKTYYFRNNGTIIKAIFIPMKGF